MQHMYGPLFAAGHGYLADNYYRMRRQGLDAAYRYAKRFKNLDGAFYHDVTDRYGRGADYDSDNCTPSPQLAMAMWHYYRYTGDEAFLRETVLPVMIGAGRLYLSLLHKEEDGLYHLSGTTAYEGNPPCRDAITDMATIRVLFPVLREYDAERREKYDDVLAHLPDFIAVPLENVDWDGDVFTFGIGAGEKPLADNGVLAYGRDDEGRPRRRSYGDPACDKGGYGFPDVELAPVYPSGLVGLAQKDTLLFQRLHNQLMLHPVVHGCMHWCMVPLYMARMGMANKLPAYLREFLSEWQVFPNGFDGDGPAGARYARERLCYTGIYCVGSDFKTKTETFRFRYFDFETTPIAAHAASEALLQSYDGILRICPATPAEDKVAFRLFAEGGFIVQAEVTADSYVLTVDNLRGEPCLLKLPAYGSQTPHVYRLDGDTAAAVQPVVRMEGNEQVLDLTGVFAKGQRLLLCSEEIEALQLETPAPAQPNATMKECGKATLGSPALPRRN